MERIDLDHRGIDGCAFALLDPLRGDATAWSAWTDLPQYPLTPEGFEAQATQLPCVLDLRATSDAARHRLLGLLLNHPPAVARALCVALLETQAKPDRMALHLRRLLAPHFPQGQRGVFRYYDPVVFEHLMWMLEPRSLASLFGPIERWILPVRGAWHAPTPPPDDARLRGFPFHLPAATWRRVQRIGAIHAVLDHDPVWRAAPTTWGPRAEALLVRAERHRLTDRDDAVAFAVHGLRWHRNFDRHPRVAALLGDCAGHPCRYRRLAGGWATAHWRSIADDLDDHCAAPSSAAATSV